MKVRIKIRPTGYISLDGGPLNVWPQVGTVVELPDTVAEDLIRGGQAEKVRLGKAESVSEPVETRPAPSADEEQRPAARRPAGKKDTSDGA
jgi:hypothetical protein